MKKHIIGLITVIIVGAIGCLVTEFLPSNWHIAGYLTTGMAMESTLRHFTKA